MNPSQSVSGPLEDHIRGLILTNTDQEATPSSERISQAGVELASGQPPPNNARQPPRGGKRRPNQAQRRQMNAELAIPFNAGASPRPLYSQQHSHSQLSQQRHQHSPSLPHSSVYPVDPGNQATPGVGYSYKQSWQANARDSGSSFGHQPDWRHRQHSNLNGSSNALNTKSTDSSAPHGSSNPTRRQVGPYMPGGLWQTALHSEQLASQSAFLDQLCSQVVTGAEIGPIEIAEKERFRKDVETICQRVVSHHESTLYGLNGFESESVGLKCFGSLASGFATKASDMDLGLVSPMSRLSPESPESPIPRLIEGALLAAGFGARLLTKTRVPIIKLCEKPDAVLRKSLQDARQRWENGVDQDWREQDNDGLEDGDLFLDTNPATDTDQNRAPPKPQTQGPLVEAQGLLPPKDGLLSLRQASNQSLSSYYSNAKRLLRRLNGRDVNTYDYQDFTESEFTLLDQVASAFVEGLYDTNLRSRISAYPSFNAGNTPMTINHRSLSGVNTMIEGEKLVLLWETRQLFSIDERIDKKYENECQQWKALQHCMKFGDNPNWFNKELQLCVASLRKIPIIQLMQLQQDQLESPTRYHDRTERIARELSGSFSLTSTDIHSYIIQHYVNGIRDAEIRNKTRDFVLSTGTQVLRTAARKHKALHLAAVFERAIDQGYYRPEEIPCLQSYIAILRREFVRSNQRTTDFEYLIPITQNEVAILGRIKELPYPASLFANKDRHSDSLGFPESGVGVQCDINFSAHLALHNTSLLRCYSHTDPRVRPIVLFIKHWAKIRGINTPYHGTLSSYGYVLMVLHYLVNVANPFVCPNLQELAPPDESLPAESLAENTTCQGYNVRFWRDEPEIQALAQRGQLNWNHDSVGTLLRGFFDYYAQGHTMATVPKKAFDWGRDVISLRTRGGLLSKAEKGWTGAKTVVQAQGGATTELGAIKAQSVTEQAPKSKDVKEVRHRFLFAIEDPFELDHNVARTVTHNGIVAIRDEFRRAWRIIRDTPNGRITENLLEDIKARREGLERQLFTSLLGELHGNEVFVDSMIA